jgi:hypothetical protein
MPFNRALSQLFSVAERLKSTEPVGVLADVQEAQDYPDRCLLADDGQDVCTDTSMVFAKDRLGLVAMEEHERVEENT